MKKYKVETLHTAVSLADRYLVKIIGQERNLPCLISLATVCLLMAAKLEENISPSFLRMISILNDEHKILLKK